MKKEKLSFNSIKKVMKKASKRDDYKYPVVIELGKDSADSFILADIVSAIGYNEKKSKFKVKIVNGNFQIANGYIVLLDDRLKVIIK
jgi:uncharacterized membrane protein